VSHDRRCPKSDIPTKGLIIRQLDQLNEQQLEQLLRYSRMLARPTGEAGADLIRDARKLTFTQQDLEEMERAIEEDCESINSDAW
jgi:hypothetical protein